VVNKYQATALISSYKSQEFLKYKIQNIRESTAKIQIIIIDCNNGEDVKTIKPSSDIKIKIHKHRITIWQAINEAIQLADSEYVVQSNTDDLVHKTAFSKQIAKLNEGHDIVYFDYHISSGYYQTWDRAVQNIYTTYTTPTEGYSEGEGLGMFPMWRKSLHKEVGYFNNDLEICGDSLFWHNLRKYDKKFCRIPEVLGIYAQRHGHNLESNPIFMAKDNKILKQLRSNPKS
jgi:hypothetical protein